MTDGETPSADAASASPDTSPSVDAADAAVAEDVEASGADTTPPGPTDALTPEDTAAPSADIDPPITEDVLADADAGPVEGTDAADVEPAALDAALADVEADVEEVAAEPDATQEAAPTVEFVAPANNASFDEGTAVTITALVSAGDVALEALSWALSSDLDGAMDTGSVSATGLVEVTTSTLSPGGHTLTLTVSTPTLPDAAQATLNLEICAVMSPDDFSSDIEAAGWSLYGNAYWDTGGWLELTGLVSGGGSIYKVSETLKATDTTTTTPRKRRTSTTMTPTEITTMTKTTTTTRKTTKTLTSTKTKPRN